MRTAPIGGSYWGVIFSPYEKSLTVVCKCRGTQPAVPETSGPGGHNLFVLSASSTTLSVAFVRPGKLTEPPMCRRPADRSCLSNLATSIYSYSGDLTVAKELQIQVSSCSTLVWCQHSLPTLICHFAISRPPGAYHGDLGTSRHLKSST